MALLKFQGGELTLRTLTSLLSCSMTWLSTLSVPETTMVKSALSLLSPTASDSMLYPLLANTPAIRLIMPLSSPTNTEIVWRRTLHLPPETRPAQLEQGNYKQGSHISGGGSGPYLSLAAAAAGETADAATAAWAEAASPPAPAAAATAQRPRDGVQAPPGRSATAAVQPGRRAAPAGAGRRWCDEATDMPSGAQWHLAGTLLGARWWPDGAVD